jgi:phosphoserine phosphatase RsbU/P
MNKTRFGDGETESLRRRVAELEHALAAASEQLQLAAQVHRSLMPHPFRDRRIWVDLRYVPIEEVGGDYCQVRFCDRDRVYFVIYDVTGHGVGPALLAAVASSEVRHSILYGREPRDVVRSLNSVICDHFSATGLYLTFFVARVDLTFRTITWSGAGHPSPLLIRRGGAVVETLDSQNPMIGIAHDILSETPDETRSLESGDRLVLFTDGLSEAADVSGRRLGTEGLSRIAAAGASLDLFRLADHVLGAVAQFQHGPTIDDQTLIVAEMR